MIPGNDTVEDHLQLLSNVRQAYGTQVLSSEMNRMIPGTGSTESAYNFVMGLTYFLGKMKQDYKRAIGHFQEAVHWGNTDSYRYLGVHYGEGHGVQQDRKKAYRMFERGANQGDFECQYEVGYYLMNGYGVKRDGKKGVEILKCAASYGSVRAAYALGERFGNEYPAEADDLQWDDVQAVKYYKMTAEAGHLDALYKYGWFFLCGNGVQKNSMYAVVLLRTAVNGGSLNAMEKLGSIWCFC